MIYGTSIMEDSNYFYKDFYTGIAPKVSKNISLFIEDNNSDCGKEGGQPNKTIPPMKIRPFPAPNSATPPIIETDTLRPFNNPRAGVVVKFYSSGTPHYVQDFYDGVLIKQTEYTSDGIEITLDEYVDGVLRKHTENYPSTGEKWIIEEYTKKGEPLRYYEYKPNGQQCDYKEFPVEE